MHLSPSSLILLASLSLLIVTGALWFGTDYTKAKLSFRMLLVLAIPSTALIFIPHVGGALAILYCTVMLWKFSDLESFGICLSTALLSIIFANLMFSGLASYLQKRERDRWDNMGMIEKLNEAKPIDWQSTND